MPNKNKKMNEAVMVKAEIEVKDFDGSEVSNLLTLVELIETR